MKIPTEITFDLWALRKGNEPVTAVKEQTVSAKTFLGLVEKGTGVCGDGERET